MVHTLFGAVQHKNPALPVRAFLYTHSLSKNIVNQFEIVLGFSLRIHSVTPKRCKNWRSILSHLGNRHATELQRAHHAFDGVAEHWGKRGVAHLEKRERKE